MSDITITIPIGDSDLYTKWLSATVVEGSPQNIAFNMKDNKSGFTMMSTPEERCNTLNAQIEVETKTIENSQIQQQQREQNRRWYSFTFGNAARKAARYQRVCENIQNACHAEIHDIDEGIKRLHVVAATPLPQREI